MVERVIPSVWALAFAAVLALGSGSAHADMIVNGSFENPSVGGGFTIFGNGSVPGWTSNNNEIEIDASSVVGLPNYNGTQSVELNGNTFDTISQTLTGLVVGQQYLLTWGYAGRSGSGNEQMNVMLDNTQVGQNTNNGTGTMSWSTNSAIIRATATSQVLSFAAINVGGNATVGNELDGVTLNAYVPEPATLAIIASALLGVGVLRRQRNRREARPVA